MRFILLRASPAVALAATAQWGAVLRRPGQSLRWPELARESRFVISLCGDDPVAAGH